MKTFEEIYNELQNSENNEFTNIWQQANEERKKVSIAMTIIYLIVDTLIIFLLYPRLQVSFPVMKVFFILIAIVVIDFILYAIINNIFSKNRKKYKQMYKEVVITKLMNNFYTDLEYFPQKRMPQYVYNEAEYNELYNRYNSEDYFEALLNNKYGIQMAEVKTEKEETYTDSDGNTRTRTRLIFHGLFAKVSTDKSIKCELRITKNGGVFWDKNRIKMDSSEFEKCFDVQTTNKIIAMQLLTSDVMQELVDFTNKTNMQYDIFINNNNLYLRFHCGPMFEPENIKRGVVNKQTVEKYFYMLNFTYNLANKLTKEINDAEV